jgi:hypothetical protein
VLEEPKPPWYRRWMVDLAIVVVVVGAVVAGAVVWSRAERTVSPATVTGVVANTTKQGSTEVTLAARTSPSRTSAAPQPGVLWEQSGSGVHSGTWFDAPAKWRIFWWFDCRSFAGHGGGNFKITSGGDFEPVGVQETAVSKRGSYRVTGAGRGRLVIESVCERWTVRAVAA